jgi:predicted metal-dependent hydrolase
LGRRYRLRVVEHNGAAKVFLRGNSLIDLYIRKGSRAEEREQVLGRWYRTQLKALIPPLLHKWQPVLGVRVAGWGVKKMKTKWGSCNSNAKRIWLNLELAKKPVQCLEYIVFHEMVHLLERRHNDRFHALINQFMPQRRLYREELNRSPLGHATWEY